jgi:hypothetical protein
LFPYHQAVVAVTVPAIVWRIGWRGADTPIALNLLQDIARFGDSNED